MFTPEKNIFTILGQALPIYGKNLKYLAVITLMAFIPIFAFTYFIPQAYEESIAQTLYILSSFTPTYNTAAELMAIIPEGVLEDIGTYVLISFGIHLVFFPISVAAATYLVFKHEKEEGPTFGGMFTAALPILPKMMVTSAIAFGFIYLMLNFTIDLLEVPFIGGFLLMLSLYFAVGMVFYQHIVADVGRWGFNAVSLSRFIIRGRWFRVFFGVIVIFAGYSILAMLFTFIGLALGIYANILTQLPFFLMRHFIQSYFAIAFALWYFDIKRFHTLNFQEIEKEIMEKMRQHMDRFGKREDGDEEDEDKKDE